MANHWKTGFYYIAVVTDLPLVMSFIDYVRKEGGFGLMLMPTGIHQRRYGRDSGFY
jgi:hypothetical protein